MDAEAARPVRPSAFGRARRNPSVIIGAVIVLAMVFLEIGRAHV